MAQQPSDSSRKIGDLNPELLGAFRACGPFFVFAMGLSFAFNILFLAYPAYIMLIHGTVVASNSYETLFYLTLMAAGALITLAAVDILRAFLMVRAEARMDAVLSDRVMQALVEMNASRGSYANAQTLRDLDGTRKLLTNPSLTGSMDLPFAPIFLLVIFWLHFALGMVALIGMGIMLALTVAQRTFARRPMRESSKASAQGYNLAGAAIRNSDVIQAMGMFPGVFRKLKEPRDTMIQAQQQSGEREAYIQGPLTAIRRVILILVIAVGAGLVIAGSIGVGAMFGAMILTMRALMPLQSVVGLWQAYGQVQVPMERISDLLDQVPDRERRGTELPAPAGELRAEAVSYAYPGQGEPLLRNIAFRLPAGEALGVIGPSGSGKSTLARLLVGARAPAKGHVRLDGADVAKWDHVQLGPYLGYLPQDVEIFEGTLAQNVARFTDYSEAALWEAIDRAGLREMVDGLPDGVATRIGDEGVRLSGGQRQRVGLARALFGRPKVLVLDEPDASLDAAGQAALFEALRTLKAEGTTVVIIGHHLRLLRETDKILALRNGQMDYFGPAAKALKKLDPAHSQPAEGGEGGEGEAGTEAAPSSQAGS